MIVTGRLFTSISSSIRSKSPWRNFYPLVERSSLPHAMKNGAGLLKGPIPSETGFASSNFSDGVTTKPNLIHALVSFRDKAAPNLDVRSHSFGENLVIRLE